MAVLFGAVESSSAKTTASPLACRFVSIRQISKGNVRVEVPVDMTERDEKG